MFEYTLPNDGKHDKNDTKASFSYSSIMLIDLEERWIHAAKKYDHYTLLTVKRGVLRLWTSAGTAILEENNAVILPPLTKIRTGSSDDSGVCFFEASFTASEPFFEPMSVYRINDTASVFSGLDRLYKTRLEDCGNSILKDTLLYSVISEISACPASDMGKSGELVNEVCRIVDENLCRELDIDTIADILGLDRSHISRVFSDTVGKTIKNYINDKRIAYACDLLSGSSFNISKIAALTGFGECNLFTKFFSYHTGITPSDYRRGIYNISPRSKHK